MFGISLPCQHSACLEAYGLTDEAHADRSEDLLPVITRIARDRCATSMLNIRQPDKKLAVLFCFPSESKASIMVENSYHNSTKNLNSEHRSYCLLYLFLPKGV